MMRAGSRGIHFHAAAQAACSRRAVAPRIAALRFDLGAAAEVKKNRDAFNARSDDRDAFLDRCAVCATASLALLKVR